MKRLEDTKAEVCKVTDLQFSIWDRLNSLAEDEAGSPVGSPGYNGSANPLGGFFGDAAYAWLSSGPRLVIINVKTGTTISSWSFREIITSVSPFPAQPGQVPLLLVGLDNGANKIRDSSGMVCIFDCTISQVLRAIRTPTGVEQVCVIKGGAEWEEFDDKRLDNFPVENNGLICAALRNLDHLLIDLRRSSWEGAEATRVADESSPAELDFSRYDESAPLRHNRSSREKHAVYKNLMNHRLEQYIDFNRDEFESTTFYQHASTSSMIYSQKIGCLVSGCRGRVIIWQMDGDVKLVSSPIDDNPENYRFSITNLALLEPTDDPRPFCYLWASYQEETSRRPPILQMYAMVFEQKYSDKGSNVYFNLKNDPSVDFELELEDGDTIVNLNPITRESNPEQTESGIKRIEESLLLISLDSRTLLFDLNHWYKERLPRTIDDPQMPSRNPNVFIASYRTRPEFQTIGDDAIISFSYIPSSVKDFPRHGSSPPEELFFPNSLSLEWVELGSGRLTFWMTRGIQGQLLREISLAGPVIFLEPSETIKRCVSAGLIPFNAKLNYETDKDAQRETLLSLCLEQRWSNFLLRCAQEWSDGSASYLFHAFCRWVTERTAWIKKTASDFSDPLFDQSGSSIIGEAEVRTLRFFGQQLECISNVVKCLIIESIDFTKERRSLHRLSTYFQVLLWFYDVGLLPETQKIDDETTSQLEYSPRIPYPFEKISSIYKEKREQSAAKNPRMNRDNNEEDLFIDELLTRECPSLKLRWECERAGEYELSIGGNYPPSTLESLLRSYIENCYKEDSNEMENKHQITIYLLMDLVMLLQDSCPGAKDKLIKYPSAFKLSPSLINLTQAFWLLDQGDYQRFLDTMTGQLVSDSDVKDWHHKLVLRTLISNGQNKLALNYLRVRKPPLSTLEDQGVVISLSVEHGLVQSAFHRRPPSHYSQLLTRFFRACKIYGKLNDILHLSLSPEEEEAFVKFLEEEKSEETRLLYYLQRCRYAEASTVYPAGIPSGRGNFSKPSKPASFTIYNAYNATLPDITKKFSSKINRRIIDIDPDSRYPRPMSHRKNRGASRELHENVIKKAKETFVRCERSQIPFISAPCSSLRSGTSNVDTSCVLFVEKAKKPYGKRSLDEMRNGSDDRTNNDNNGDERKRRKTSGFNDTTDAIERKELGMSMVFDTPLIKRKNQMISARDTPMETPHSILKIRQLIRDSTSSNVVEKSSVELAEKSNVEKERKPRQIRFSIGQQRVDEPMEDCSPLENTNMGEGDVNNDSDETEKSLSKCEASDEEAENEEVYFSPDVSGKSFRESTILSDSSPVISDFRNISGPRPRPSLRRSAASSDDSSNDLRRRSLMKASSTPSFLKSTKNSGKSSHDEKTSVETLSFSQSFRGRPSLFSDTVYTESILSSDTSIEFTPSRNKEEKEANSRGDLSSFAERSMDKFGSNRENSNTSSRSVSVKTITRTSIVEEYARDCEEDKNSEVLMEVDGFGLDRDSETRSRLDVESNGELDRISEREGSFVPSSASKTSEIEENPLDKREEEREEKESGEQRDIRDDSQKVETNEIIEETEVNEDYDDELIALKYDEEDEPEEAFQSLTNSMDVDNSTTILSTTSEEPDKINVSSENGFYEEPKLVSQQFAITDDESSRSVDGFAISAAADAPLDTLDKTLSINKLENEIHDGISNMTDDESEESRDSSIFSNRIPQKTAKLEEQVKNSPMKKITDESESSRDSSIFSPKNRKKNIRDSKKKDNSLVDSEKEADESRSSSVAETLTSNEAESEKTEISPMPKKGRQSARISKIGTLTPKKSTKQDAEATNVTPLRITRSRRASSVVQDALASPAPESPSLKTKSEKVGRLRRGSSLAKDTTSSDSNLSKIVSSETENLPDVPPGKKSRLQRSTSLAKEIFATKSFPSEESSREEELPIRRSTRRAASVQKEISEKTTGPKLRTRSSSKASLADETIDEGESASSKRTTRGARGSSVSKEIEATVAPKRLTRASSLVKEIPEIVEEAPKRIARKRGSSVPKDTPSETNGKGSSQRTRRGGSVSKEIIPEESSPASGTRVRLSSITSIAEESDDDEIFSADQSRGKTAANERRTSWRERRAVSVDAPSVDVKRRTRAASLKSAISQDPIEEENSEGEISAEPKSRTSRKASGRRKKTDSGSSLKDDEEVANKSIAKKAPQRRTRKLSQRSNESTGSFKFSPPDRLLDEPDDDQKEADEAHDYVFSPPHTRSKFCTSNQPRRKLKPFIYATEEEKEAARGPFRPIKKKSCKSVCEITEKRSTYDLFKEFRLRIRAKSTAD